MKIRYVIISVSFLCLVQPLIRLRLFYTRDVFLLVLFVALLALAGFAFVKRRHLFRSSLYASLCVYYACIIAGIGLIHMAGLLDAAGNASVNVQHMSMHTALKGEVLFSFGYLLFPVMLLGQFVFSERLDVRWVLRAMAAIAGISASVAIYQRFVNAAFLHSPWWGWVGRYEGLATDPNALGLMMFLSIPLVIAGIRLEKGNVVRAGYLALLVLFLVAEWGTQSRTSTAGTILFFLFLPVLAAWSERRRWGIGTRVALVISPFLALSVMILALQSMPYKGNATSSPESRLANTWHKYAIGGISAVFFHDEARGRLFREAIDLIRMAPVAGWGPGGFYREHSNYVLYSHQSIKEMTHDSPLNHYLMIACDFGIPMMLLNLVLILAPSILGLVTLTRIKNDGDRFMALVLVASNSVFLLVINTMPPSYFIGVLWVWAAQLALLMSVAAKHHVRMGLPVTRTGRRAWMAAATIAALIVLTGGYHTAFGGNGYKARLTSPWWMMSNP